MTIEDIDAILYRQIYYNNEETLRGKVDDVIASSY